MDLLYTHTQQQCSTNACRTPGKAANSAPSSDLLGGLTDCPVLQQGDRLVGVMRESTRPTVAQFKLPRRHGHLAFKEQHTDTKETVSLSLSQLCSCLGQTVSSHPELTTHGRTCATREVENGRQRKRSQRACAQDHAC